LIDVYVIHQRFLFLGLGVPGPKPEDGVRETPAVRTGSLSDHQIVVLPYNTKVSVVHRQKLCPETRKMSGYLKWGRN